MRYLVRGFVDGSLSVLGVVIGAMNADYSIIIAAGVGGGVANGLSNIFGAMIAETTEVERELSRIERAMLSELRGTELEKEYRKNIVKMGVSDGLATILGSFVPILPIIAAAAYDIAHRDAILLSVLTTVFCLGVIGGYVGRLSRKNVAVSAIKMALFGVITAVVSTLLEGAIHEIT